MPQKIYFIHHPRTEVSPGICYGNSDVKPDGTALRETVGKVRSKINLREIDVCYSSPLLRCTMLAELLLPDSLVVNSERLREIDFGRWELVPWADIPIDEQEEWGRDFVNCKIHGGENFFDVQKRIMDFLNEVVQTGLNNVLVVTHAGLLRALLAHLLDASPRKIFAMNIDFGEVIALEWFNKEYYSLKYM